MRLLSVGLVGIDKVESLQRKILSLSKLRPKGSRSKKLYYPQTCKKLWLAEVTPI